MRGLRLFCKHANQQPGSNEWRVRQKRKANSHGSMDSSGQTGKKSVLQLGRDKERNGGQTSNIKASTNAKDFHQ